MYMLEVGSPSLSPSWYVGILPRMKGGLRLVLAMVFGEHFTRRRSRCTLEQLMTT